LDTMQLQLFHQRKFSDMFNLYRTKVTFVVTQVKV
jgi:hypothetical protein